ncbi:MAG: RlmE family RNA methyltransferase [Lautropia sp.]
MKSRVEKGKPAIVEPAKKKPRFTSNKVNKVWLHEHLTDPYVKLAQQHDYRSRAAFKLTGIDDQDRLIRPGMTVVDLGSAPGSWSQVLRERLGRTPDGTLAGRIVALDLLPMAPIADVDFIQGDFREADVLARLEALLGGARVDLVVSDMAPNLSGVGVADMARMQDLAELALAFAADWLAPEGSLLIKCFHGSGYSQLVQAFKQQFVSVLPRKPKASRDRSAETYLLGRRLKRSGSRRQGQPDR